MGVVESRRLFSDLTVFKPHKETTGVERALASCSRLCIPAESGAGSDTQTAGVPRHGFENSRRSLVDQNCSLRPPHVHVNRHTHVSLPLRLWGGGEAGRRVKGGGVMTESLTPDS